uniref:Uncharacterized protein n=1 Tax=Oryza meridionalis TaxID=40149 RepID=A0A0E0CK44_9ORYZ
MALPRLFWRPERRRLRLPPAAGAAGCEGGRTDIDCWAEVSDRDLDRGRIRHGAPSDGDSWSSLLLLPHPHGVDADTEVLSHAKGGGDGVPVRAGAPASLQDRRRRHW